MTKEQAMYYQDLVMYVITSGKDLEYTKGLDNLLRVVARKDNAKEEIYLREFLHYILFSYTEKMDSEIRIDQKVSLIYDAKMRILNLIESFKQKVKMEKSADGDFSTEVMNRISVAIEKVKLELEVQKHNLEVEKLRIETKWYKEPIFLLGAAITAITFIVTIYNGCNTHANPANDYSETRTNNYYNDSPSHKLPAPQGGR